MDVVRKKFCTKSVIYKDSIVLYSSQNAIEVIKFCATINKKIYGLDAFKLVDSGIKPFLEFSTDYSCDETVKVYEKAINHIQELFDKNLYFEIVYEGYSA